MDLLSLSIGADFISSGNKALDNISTGDRGLDQCLTYEELRTGTPDQIFDLAIGVALNLPDGTKVEAVRDIFREQTYVGHMGEKRYHSRFSFFCPRPHLRVYKACLLPLLELPLVLPLYSFPPPPDSQSRGSAFSPFLLLFLNHHFFCHWHIVGGKCLKKDHITRSQESHSELKLTPSTSSSHRFYLASTYGLGDSVS